jgi:hypothetical protein
VWIEDSGSKEGVLLISRPGESGAVYRGAVERRGQD